MTYDMSVHGTDGRCHYTLPYCLSAERDSGPITVAFPTLRPGWDVALQDTLEKNFGFPRALEPVRINYKVAKLWPSV